MKQEFKELPKNRAQAWFRVLLWIMPAGFTCGSAAGLSWLQATHFPALAEVDMPILLVLILLFVIGSGWFDSLLSSRARSESASVADGLMRFFIFQLVLIPVLSAAFLFFACLIDPIKF